MQRSLRLSLSLSGVAALVLAGTPLLPAVAEESAAVLRHQQYDKLLEEIELLKQRNEQLEAQISGSSQGKEDAFDLHHPEIRGATSVLSSSRQQSAVRECKCSNTTQRE